MAPLFMVWRENSILLCLTISLPVASRYVEADGQFLNTRREKMSVQHVIRLAIYQSNPAHEVTFPPNT